jgi:two-component system, LuxR family, response regulator FixJ
MNDAAQSRAGIVRVVDDDQGVRESSKVYLSAAGYEVETYTSGDELFARADLSRGGCVLLDLQMPGMSGLEVLRRLKMEYPRVAVVMVTGHGDVSTAVSAMKIGATDFLEKPYEAEALLEAIDRAQRNAAEAPPAMRASDAKARIAALSPRECEVLSALVAGNSNKAIAYDLGLSPRTVEMHRANMMEKLGARSLPEALRIAYEAGLTQP